jgi:hypothetical protein
MVQLRRDYDQFVKLNTKIIVAGPETADAFRNYWTKENLPCIRGDKNENSVHA